MNLEEQKEMFVKDLINIRDAITNYLNEATKLIDACDSGSELVIILTKIKLPDLKEEINYEFN